MKTDIIHLIITFYAFTHCPMQEMQSSPHYNHLLSHFSVGTGRQGFPSARKEMRVKKREGGRQGSGGY